MLNDRQIAAIQATEGSVKIVAGAGSGKTSVLAHRYAFLVGDLGISPANILCMTFTNKAAQEMKQRIARLVEKGAVNDFICTIHGFCAKLLRREIYRIGWPKNFLILDEADARQLARQVMQEYGIDRRKTTAERFVAEIGKIKGASNPAYILQHFLPQPSADAPSPHDRYMQLQMQNFALDYDDLLYITLHILASYPDAREYWLDTLNYIMVDEAQDCSSDDWRLIRTLAEGHGNLFIVGDPDQAIYEWRGANPALFVEWPAKTQIILDRNYRSTPQILNVANDIIANNRNRIPKDLYSRLPDGVVPTHIHAKSLTDEASQITAIIREGLRDGKPLDSFAILYRASYLSAEIEHALVSEKIPYTVWGGLRFYDRMEIKDVIAYLRLVSNPDDDIAFTRIANVPARKFGKVRAERLRALAEAENSHLYPTLLRHLDDSSLATPAMRTFCAVIEQARLRSTVVSVADTTEYILNATGYLDMLRTDAAEERLENLAQLTASIIRFARENTDDDASLQAYLHNVALASRADEDDPQKGPAVRLMTIHQAKGLEFPTVFVVGLTEGTFPSHRSIRERREAGEEEERRLMYVAVTRAMHNLYLTETEGYLNAEGALKFPSRFLTEIKEENIQRSGPITHTLFDSTRRRVQALSEEVYGVRPLEAALAVGQRVMHKVFGEGIVEAVNTDAGTYKIRFADGSSRHLVPRVLTPLN